MYPTGSFIFAIAFFIICVILIVAPVALKHRLTARGVPVYAQVTHIIAPHTTLSGLSDHTYRIFARWTDPQTRQTYYFAKDSHDPLDYREGDFVPARINLEHPWFRHLDV